MLIVFEGIDGAGKNTQIRKLLSYFRQQKIPYRLHKYPTKKAKAAFMHLSGKRTVPPIRLAEVFADDIVSEKGKLEREICEGAVAVCDRYLHSTLAYQGVGFGFSRLKTKIGRMGALVPDLVVLLDIDPKVSFERKKRQKTPDRHERDVPFLSRVRKNYLLMKKAHFLAYKYVVVDASLPADEVFSEIIMNVEPFLTGKGK